MNIRSKSLVTALLIFFALCQLHPSFAAAKNSNITIDADAESYQMRWSGNTGQLIFKTGEYQTSSIEELSLLRIDPGPDGYANYLVWFLGREKTGFSLCWCYMNASGNSFYSWIYRYPSDHLSSVNFQGRYSFKPPSAPFHSQTMSLTLQKPVTYTGMDFKYQDWTRQGGVLKDLRLYNSNKATFSKPSLTSHSSPVKTVDFLKVSPLYNVTVASENGWRKGGWEELHALAIDSQNHPYFLILYSSVSSGYAINLETAQLYLTKFASPVEFLRVGAYHAKSNEIGLPPIPLIPEYQQIDIPLKSSKTWSNPYTEVTLTAELHRPDGQNVSVPGFWDGQNNWKIRISPTMSGDWSWTTNSNDPGLNGQRGQFNCVADPDERHGFFQVNPVNYNSFQTSGGAPFFSAPIYYPLMDEKSGPISSSPSVSKSRVSTQELNGTEEDSRFKQFSNQVDQLVSLGFDRFIGTALSLSIHSLNPFPNANADQIDPGFFQELDKRISYCNHRGVVPDIGVYSLKINAITSVQMARIWKYLIARYSAYNICWNLSLQPVNSGETSSLQQLSAMIRSSDPVGHPITAVLESEALHNPPPVIDQTISANNDYIHSPAGLALWPNRNASLIQQNESMRFYASRTDVNLQKPLDMITLDGKNFLTIAADMEYNKPLSVYNIYQDQTSSEQRILLWKTIFQGSQQIMLGNNAFETNNQISKYTKWASICYNFLRGTRYNSLHPRHYLQSSAENDSLNNAEVFLLDAPSWQYAAYFTHGGTISIDLLEAIGKVEVAWFNPDTGAFLPPYTLIGGGRRTFSAPNNNDWVLLITRH